MKNITFSADERLIQQARTTARLRNTTLNEEFRKWLETYSATEREQMARDFRGLMHDLRYVRAGRTYSRDEMNER